MREKYMKNKKFGGTETEWFVTLKQTHSKSLVPRYLCINIEQCQTENSCIQLKMRQEGFDVVILFHEEVTSVQYFAEYKSAKAIYDYFKKSIKSKSQKHNN